MPRAPACAPIGAPLEQLRTRQRDDEERERAQQQLRAPIFEDKVVDLIFGKAKIEEKEVSKEELLEEDDLPEGYGG